MGLQMKRACEACGTGLPPEGTAYICTFECTFCAACANEGRSPCPNCAGELVRRPRKPSRPTPP